MSFGIFGKMVILGATVLACMPGRAAEFSALDSSWAPEAVDLAPRNESMLLPFGSHVGRPVKGGVDVTLMLRPVPGRAQSALAVLTQGLSRVAVYLVDPMDELTFVFKPMVAMKNGEIGVPNDNPSLVLNLGPMKGDRRTFVLMNANSGNTAGLQGTVKFEGKSSNLTWENYEDGKFKQGKQAATLSPMSSDGIGKAMLEAGAASGSFSVREKLPGVYVFSTVVVSNTGISVGQGPGRLGLFLRQGRSRYLVLGTDTGFSQVVVMKRD